MNWPIIILMIYWIPIYACLIIWTIRIRIYVKKNNIESLDTTHPLTYKKGKLTDFQKLGEVLVYAIAAFCGIFTVFILPVFNMIKYNTLPDE
jgi:hypothetical protein